MLDYQAFQLINNLALKNVMLDYIGIFLATYFIWLLFFLILILGLAPPHKKKAILSRANALRAILAGGLAWGMSGLLGILFFRPRPFVGHEVFKLIERLFTSKSFPSDHAAISFALAGVIFLYNKKVGIWFLTSASLIAISRVYVGVHYPLDILAGAVLGILSALIIKKLIPVKFNQD